LPKTPHEYESLLKSEMRCHKCQTVCKNVPELKVHLKEEWEKEKKAKLRV